MAAHLPAVVLCLAGVVCAWGTAGCRKVEARKYPPASTLSALRAISEEVAGSADDVVKFAKIYDQGSPGGIWKEHLSGDWMERCRVVRRFGALLVEASRHVELDAYRTRLDEPVQAIWKAVEGMCDGASPGPLPAALTEGGKRKLRTTLDLFDGRLKELSPPLDGGPPPR